MSDLKIYMRAGVLLFALVVFTYGAKAQGNDQMSATAPVGQPYHPVSIEGGGELWYPLSNYALRMNFGGVYSFHLSPNFMLAKHIYAGIEGQYNQLSAASPEAIKVALNLTNIFYYGVGAKLSYYSSETGDWFFSPSLTVGETWLSFNHLPAGFVAPPGGLKGQAVFISPRVCEGLRVNDELHISLEITYTYYNYSFDPTYVGITTTQYPSSQTSAKTQMLGWGFSITYYLGKPKTL